MSTRLGIIVGLALAGLVVIVFGASVWVGEQAPPEVFDEISFDSLDPTERQWVRLTGQAHYPSRLRQIAPPTLLRPERTYELWGFFPENATAQREIPVLVRTQRRADRIVAFETLTIEGRLVLPSRNEVPPDTERRLGEHSGYFFGEPIWLLQPVRILSEDGVWEEPGG